MSPLTDAPLPDDAGDALRPARLRRKRQTPPSTRAAELKAAVVVCLGRMRASDITVDDVVRTAGIARRTFYRVFDTRQALFAAVLHERAEAIAAKVERFNAGCERFEDAIVFGTLETLRLIEEDALFRALAESDNQLVLDIISMGAEGSNQTLFAQTWAEVFQRGYKAGAIRMGVDATQVSRWLQGVHHMLMLRRDLTTPDKQALLVSFVLPSITLREPGKDLR